MKFSLRLGAFALFAVLLMPDLAVAEEFECPEGARDSGNTPETQPGTVVRWCEISRDGRPLYHGPLWRWHRNGEMAGKEYYVDGNAEGEWQSWYGDGTKRTLGTFRDGAKTGHWTYRYDTGKIRTEVTYGEDGNATAEYYPDGNRKFEGRYWRGGKIGQWTYWDRDGTEKARCDFGAGLFDLPDDACRTIAGELWPEGYSRPVPAAVKSEDGNAEIAVASLAFGVTTPAGWVADIEAGKEDGLPLVLYPKGGAWRGGEPNIYFRVLFRDARSFADVVEDEGRRFSKEVADYTETSRVDGATVGGRPSVTQSISYRSVTQTDSPFAIIGETGIYVRVSFLDVSDKFVLVAVLVCNSEALRAEFAPLFSDHVASLRATR